jgi:predicted  nucleic acid-binding Zn-ribbon protein
MTLEENIQQLRDSLTVTSAPTLRHETRLKEHQEWLEANELADSKHREKMVELDGYLTRLAAAQLLTEEKLREVSAKLASFIDSLNKGGNGHN